MFDEYDTTGVDRLSTELWKSYSYKAGGKTFDGKPLPTWEELGEDRQECWRAVARRAIQIFR
jgi:hypothetical protein